MINRKLSSDAMIYRASCSHLVFESDEGVSPTRAMKLCSTDKEELEGWARENLTRKLKRCRSCM